MKTINFNRKRHFMNASRKIKKPMALCIAMLFLFGMLSYIASIEVKATSDVAFGNTAVGSQVDTNDADAQSISYFTCASTGSVTDIVAYIDGTSGGRAVAALYASNGALLGQSSSVSIGTSFSWIDFKLLTAVTVNSGATYGLAVMGNVPVNVYEVSGTGQRDHNAVSSFANGFANPFGTVWGTATSGAMSIYAEATGSATQSSTPAQDPISTPTPAPIQQPPTSTGVAFGNTAVGSQVDTNDANAQSISYFTCASTGSVTDIVAYIDGTSGGRAVAALYASNGALLGQSSSVSIGTSFSWIDFKLLTAVTVNSGATYGLAVMGNVPVNVYEVSGTGQRDHNAVSSFANGFANPFGTVWGTATSGAMSIYAEATGSATQSSTPAQDPISTPTPAPIQQPPAIYSSNNLAPIPSAWTNPYPGYTAWDLNGVANDVLDYSVLYNGAPTIRSDHIGSTANINREVDGPWIAIQPGEHIVFTAWIKITQSGYGDTSPYSGARLGIGFLDGYGRITDIMSPTYEGATYNGVSNSPNSDSGIIANFVQWGTNGWVQRTIDFVVPQTIPGDGYQTPTGSSSPAGTSCVPMGMIPELQVWSSIYGGNDPGQAWFANTQLYINP